MEIFVKDQQLDIYDESVSVTFESFLFSNNELSKPFSTTVTLPNNKHNVGILEYNGVLDRDFVLNHKLECFVVLGDINGDATLEIESIAEDEIEATIYLDVVPTIVDKPIREILPFDLHFPYIRNTVTKNAANVNSSFTADLLELNNFTNNNLMIQEIRGGLQNLRKNLNVITHLNPSISIRYLINQLYQETGVSIDTSVLSEELLLNGDDEVVCPYYTKQYLFACSTNEDLTAGKYAYLYGGQHISNDFEIAPVLSFTNYQFNSDDGVRDESVDKDYVPYTAYLGSGLDSTYYESNRGQWQSAYDSKLDAIIYNRDCTANIRIACYAPANSSFTIIKNSTQIQVFSLGNSKAENIHYVGGEVTGLGNCYYEMSQPVQLKKGDKLQFKFEILTAQTYNYNLSALVDITYSNYEVDVLSDFSRQIVYSPFKPAYTICFTDTAHVINNKHYAYHQYMSSDGTIPSFTTYGAIANLGDLTVKDLIYTLAWYFAKIPVMSKNEISFVNIREQEIDGEIMSWKPTSSSLARHNIVTYSQDVPNTFKRGTYSEFSIDNDNLVDTKNLLELKIKQATKTIGVGGSVVNYKAQIPKYDVRFPLRYQQDESGHLIAYLDAWPSATENKVGVYLLRKDASTAFIGVPNKLQLFDLDKIDRANEVEIKTFDSIKDTDVLYLNGRKYYILESTYNSDPAVENTIKAIAGPAIPASWPSGTVYVELLPSYVTEDINYNVMFNLTAESHISTGDVYIPIVRYGVSISSNASFLNPFTIESYQGEIKTKLTSGRWYVKGYAIDAGGNTGWQAEAPYIMDVLPTPPYAAFDDIQQFDNILSISYTIQGEDIDYVDLFVGETTVTTEQDDGHYTVTLSNLSPGDYYIELNTGNSQGDVTISRTFTIETY